MDVVYPVEATDDNNGELLFSLRTVVENLAHDQIWLVGVAPGWIRNVAVIPDENLIGDTKYMSTTRRLLMAASHKQVSDPFWLFNDDYFLLREIDDTFPAFHRGRMSDVLKHQRSITPNSPWTRGLARTLRILRDDFGIPEPLCFETHTPLHIYKHPFRDVVKAAENVHVLHKRSLYANTCPAVFDTAEYLETDTKLNRRSDTLDPRWPVVSTGTTTWANHPAMVRLRARNQADWQRVYEVS